MASAWLKFLKEYYAKHKSEGISYKQAMVRASKVYKKGKAAPEKKKPVKRRRRRVKKEED